jgi:6-phosphogluconolactonase
VTGGTEGKVQVLANLEAVSQRAASIFLDLSRDAIASKGRFAAALSGGSTPVRLYTLLASRPFRDRLDWRHVHFFWADERCVPKEDKESNFKLAFDNLLSRVPVPADHVHRIKGEEDPDKGAREYEEEMRNFFGGTFPVFDLILLGMGEDGHTASLFPGSKPLEERDRLALPVDREKPKTNRVTLALPVLNHAAHILFLVSGRSKADMVLKVLEGEEKERYPAGRIRPLHGNVIWLLDQEAAAGLKTLPPNQGNKRHLIRET